MNEETDPKRRNEIRSRDGIDPGNETEGFNASAGKSKRLVGSNSGRKREKETGKSNQSLFGSDSVINGLRRKIILGL